MHSLVLSHTHNSQIEIEFTVPYSCKWTWKRYPVSSDPELLPDSTVLQVVGNSIVYWPSDEDLDHRLLLECVPISPDGNRTGVLRTTISPVVISGPTVNPITRRHLLTPAHMAAPDQFRVVTYNTLAEPFTSSPHARERLYPYCDPSALDIDYRQCLIVHELLGYNADVMCLQEVDRKTFDRFLLPSLKDKGYDGCHQPKSGMVSSYYQLMWYSEIQTIVLSVFLVRLQIKEGEAIFYDTSKFSLMSVESTSLNDFFEHDPSCSELYHSLQIAPYFLRAVLKKHNIVLTVFLRSLDMPDTYLCVVNTHLYYHPMGDHIRLLQVATALKFLQTKVDKFHQIVGQHAKVATVICGDFNSCPCIAAYDFVLSGSVSQSHPDWMVYKLSEVPKCACNKRPLKGEDESSSSSSESDKEDDESQNSDRDVLGPLPALQPSEILRIPKRRLSTVDEFRGLDLKHDFHFQNATGTNHYTNYTLGYYGVLDYIFFDSDLLAVERVVPLPSHSEVTEFVALPSVYFPSDHLALVVDLKWQY